MESNERDPATGPETGDVLERIAAIEGRLSPTEQLVADYVLTLPQSVMRMSMRGLAARAGVSDASVLRFCRLLGCSGFPDFKIAIAQSFASRSQPATRPVGGDAQAVFAGLRERSAACFAELEVSLDFAAIDRAAHHLKDADRIGIFGYGASAVTALDLQHRLAGLRLPASAESDPHAQAIRVTAMTEASVAIFLAHGHSRILTGLARMAVDVGAVTVAIASPGTPVAKTCAVRIEVDAHEDTLGMPPTVSRLAHLLVIDTLFSRLAAILAEARGGGSWAPNGLEDHLRAGF